MALPGFNSGSLHCISSQDTHLGERLWNRRLPKLNRERERKRREHDKHSTLLRRKLREGKLVLSALGANSISSSDKGPGPGWLIIGQSCTGTMKGRWRKESALHSGGYEPGKHLYFCSVFKRVCVCVCMYVCFPVHVSWAKESWLFLPTLNSDLALNSNSIWPHLAELTHLFLTFKLFIYSELRF